MHAGILAAEGWGREGEPPADHPSEAPGGPSAAVLPSNPPSLARADLLSPFDLSNTSDSAVATGRASSKGCLPMSFGDYLKLFDWTGRQLRAHKPGAIPAELAPILERLHIGGTEGWLQLMGRFSRLFRRAAGRPQSLARERDQRGCPVMQGLPFSRTVFL